ncbi:MAG: adenosylmethionine--8-amino-7-oxononanoate transaminase [Cyclobacteriaceae bacterium]
MSWLKDDKKLIWHPYTSLVTEQIPLAIKKAKGVYLHTEDGRKIIDGVSSWWVNILGHANPIIAKAIGKQAKTLEHTIFAGFTHKPAVDLAKNLKKHIIPKSHSKVFFSDNGSTAVEVGIKMGLQYWFNKERKKTKIIAIEGSYHGDTFGTMSVSSPSVFNKPFQEKLYDVAFIPFPEKGKKKKTIDAFKKLISKGDVALFIFEPLVQGTAGMRMYSPEVLDSLMTIAKENEVLCLADEVMTGFGRTGKLLATDHTSNAPDIISLSKGITGGFMPLGITTCSQEIENAFQDKNIHKTFYHGHSYTGNPLACAASNASINLLVSKKVTEKINWLTKQQEQFKKKVKNHPSLLNARVTGTIFAVEIKTKQDSSYFSSVRDRLYAFFLEKNILLRPLGNIIYIMPPYTITKKELHKIYDAFLELLYELECNKF